MARGYLGLIALVSGLLPSIDAYAHHSYAEYDDQRTIEFEGRLLDVAWQNPHIRFMVEAKDENNRVVVWDIEATSVNSLHRMNVPLDILTIGQNVKFAGWPSKRAGNRIYATNLQASDRREVVLWRYSTPRWASTALGVGSAEAAPRGGGVGSDTDSLFRVWATDTTDVASLAAWFGRLGANGIRAESGQRTRSRQRHGDAGVHAQGNAHHHGSAAAHGVRGPRRHDIAANGGVRHGSHDPHDRAGKP